MIWKRYLLKETIKVFFFFLSALFFLYVLLDYSAHMQDFIKDKRIDLPQFFLYYGYQFVKRADLLIPLALLIATIKVLCSLNAKRELLALEAAGLRPKLILRPLLVIGAVCSLCNYASAEFMLPKSMHFIDSFHRAHFKHYKDKGKEPVHVIYLKDHTKLLYQHYDRSKDSFFDLFWLRSPDEIWRIKSLAVDSLTGTYVDRLMRNEEGLFEKKESFATYPFTHFKWDPETPARGGVPLENKSLSDLCSLYFKNSPTTQRQRPEILTQLTFKTTLPLLPLLCVIAAAPFCIRYSRKTSFFFIYALGLFSLLSLYVLLDAATILGANQILSPFLVIFVPFSLCSIGFLWRFSKI